MAWNDIGGNSSSEKQEVKFLTLPDGTTTIRIVDPEPFSRWVHWIPQANGGKGLSVNCPGKSCPICAHIKAAKAQKEQPKWSSRKMHALNVINRATGEINIMDKGNGLFESLAGIREELFNDVGEMTNYDVKIRVTNGGTRDASYVVIPGTAKPLTDADKALEKYDFSKVFPEYTPEQISALTEGATLDELFGNSDSAETPNGAEEQPSVDFNAE